MTEQMALKLLLTLGLFFIEEVVTDSKTRCSVPSVMMGEETNITCSFGDNINGTIDDFVIQQYPQRGKFKDLLHYYIDNDGKKKCIILEPGYYNRGQGNGTCTLTIRRASKHHEGKYMCQVTPASETNTEPCYFTLKDAETSTQPTTTQTQQTSSTSSETDEEDTVQLTLIAVVVGVVVVVVLISVAALVVWRLCRKRLRASCRKCREKHGCIATSSFSNRDSGNVSTVDIETNSRQREQTEEDGEHTQPLIPRNEAFQSDLASGETETNPTSLTSPSQGSATTALSTDSAASPSTNGPTAGEDSSQVDSEHNGKDQAYAQAVKALQQTGAVIIAGPEKCGKTTLGQELLDHFTQEGYTPHTKFTDPTMWSSYVRDPDKKCAFLFDERFKAGDKAVSQNTWTHCLRNLRDRHYPLVIIVQTSERKEEDVRPFSFLRTIPVVFAVGEKKKDSASKTMTEKEDQPRREVWHTTVDPSGKVGRTARENTEEHQLDLVIFMYTSRLEEDQRLMYTMSKEC